MLTTPKEDFLFLKNRSITVINHGQQKVTPVMAEVLTQISTHPGLALTWWSEGKPLHNHDQLYLTFATCEDGGQWLHHLYDQLYQQLLHQEVGRSRYQDLQSVRLSVAFKPIPNQNRLYPAYTLSMAVRTPRDQHAAMQALVAALALMNNFEQKMT